MDGFRKFNGEEIDNLKEYILEYLNKNPNNKVFIGCDSQRIKRKTFYAVVICFYNPSEGEGKGAHVIFKKEVYLNRLDFFSRLMGEINKLVEISFWIQKELQWDEYLNPEQKRLEVHMDLNPDPKHKSNQLYHYGIGYVKGLGFLPKAKPYSWAATYAANLIVR